MRRDLQILLLTGALAAAPGSPSLRAQTEALDPAVRSSRLQGTAALSRRNPVLGATVRVRPTDDRSRLYLTSTGERGEFRVDGLPDGEYQVQVTREGLAPVSKDAIRVKFPFRAVVELTMQPAEDAAPQAPQPPGERTVALDGYVLDEDGTPLEEARVRLVRPDGALNPRSMRTGSSGRFEFSELPTGRWRVEVEGVGYLSVRQDVDFESDSRATVFLVSQPPGYEPSPLELMPPEQPIAPPGLGDIPN